MKLTKLLLILSLVVAITGGALPINYQTGQNNIPSAEAAVPKNGTVSRRITVREAIAFSIQRVDDRKLAQGVEKIKRKGRNGTKTFKYKVTYTDGKEVSRDLISEKVTRKPKDQIVRVGTKKPVETNVTTPTPVTSTAPKTTTKPKTNSQSGNTTITPKPTPAPAPITKVHTDKDCADFVTHAAAQAYFDASGGNPSNNFDDLDRDHDGLACEALP